MNGRADIVDEAGERKRLGPDAATDTVARFEDDDLAAGLRQCNGRAKPVRS